MRFALGWAGPEAAYLRLVILETLSIVPSLTRNGAFRPTSTFSTAVDEEHSGRPS